MATRALRLAPLQSAPRGGWRWAGLGLLLGALLALLLCAPARWLADALRQWSSGHVLLLNPRGTVWNGDAALVLAGGAGGAEPVSLPGQMHWTLRPAWNGVVAALHIPCCAPAPLEFKALPRAGGLRLDWRDGQSRWPAALLSGLGAPFNTLQPEGVLELSTQSFSMQWRGALLALAGRATLEAVDISSTLSTLRPIGSYHLALEGGPIPTLLLTTRDGSLQLNGSGRWNGRALHFDGEASAAPGREQALNNLLNIMGRRDGTRSIITLG